MQLVERRMAVARGAQRPGMQAPGVVPEELLQGRAGEHFQQGVFTLLGRPQFIVNTALQQFHALPELLQLHDRQLAAFRARPLAHATFQYLDALLAGNTLRAGVLAASGRLAGAAPSAGL